MHVQASIIVPKTISGIWQFLFTLYDYNLEYIWHIISIERKERGKERREVGKRGGKGRENRKNEGRRKERERKKTNDLINHLIWNSLLVHLENSMLSFKRVLSITRQVSSSLQVHTLFFWYLIYLSISYIYTWYKQCYIIIVVLQLLSCVQLVVTPWTAAHQASLSFPISLSLLKLMFIESVKPSNHLILYHPPLLLPSVFPSIRVFSNEPALHSRWKQAKVMALQSQHQCYNYLSTIDIYVKR